MKLYTGANEHGEVYAAAQPCKPTANLEIGLGDPSNPRFKFLELEKKGMFGKSWKWIMRVEGRGKIEYTWKQTKIAGTGQYADTKQNIKLVDESGGGTIAVYFNPGVNGRQGKFEFHDIMDLNMEVITVISGLMVAEALG